MKKIDTKSFFSFCCLFAIFFSQDLPAQNFSDANRLQKIKATLPQLDSLFSNYANVHHFPSLSYGLVVDGKLIHTYHKGIINIISQRPASSTSAYHIASMTKSFTAMAILKLRDEHKLSLDDPISKYIPEARNMVLPTADSPPITIRLLLTHNSGFPEDNPWGDRQLGRSAEWLRHLYKNGVSFSTTPGTGYEYSNLGFATVGLIIQNICGEPYQNYIRKNILLPLGMTNTWWDYSNVPPNQLAMGYRYVERNWIAQPLLHSGIFGAMGGLITTIEDFSKYMAFQLSAWPPRNDPESGPVNRSDVREMQHAWNFSRVWQNEKNYKGKDCFILDSYGYGLHQYVDCDGLKVITHSGGLPGFGSQWRIVPDYGIGIVAFANLTYAPLGTPLQAAIDSLMLWAQLKPRMVNPSAILEKRKKQIVDLLPSWNLAVESEIFADNFFDDYLLKDLKKQSTDAFEKAGKILEISDIDPMNGLRGTFLLKGENKSIKIFFSLSPETNPKIQAFNMKIIEK